MSDCNDNSQKLSAAFPNKNTESSNTGIQVNGCNNNNMFDVNAMLKAAQNYIKINQAINNMIGTEVRWFRSIPQQRSKDVLFQEYTLYNVEDTPLCIKVILPDGNFPDSRYNYDLMGLEYEVPLEVQIDKKYWESNVSVGTAPQKKDIVYFSIPNKLYQVESVYLFRGFMEQETAWKINLKKYMPESSRREGEVLQDTIDQYTTSSEEIFGDMQNRDINKIVNDRQNSPFNSTERDKYKILDSNLKIVTSQMDIYGIKVAESYYDLSTSTESKAITYSVPDLITREEDRSLSLWLRPKVNTSREYNVLSILPVDLETQYNFKISTNGMNFSDGDVVNVYGPGSINFYALYSNSDELGDYFFVENSVLSYLSSIRTDWYNMKNFKIKKEHPINLLHGVSSVGVANISLTIYSNQYVKFIFGPDTYITILPEKLDVGEWHGIILNVGNTWGQFNLYVWKQHESDSISKLKNTHYVTLRASSNEIYVENYHLHMTDADITNIRWYNSTIEEEKQVNELLSYFIKDGDKAIISDNCDPLYKSPYIAKQR